MTTAMVGSKEAANEKRQSSGVEARKRRRLRVSLPVQVQPFDARFADIRDVGEVTDFSREGLYFLTCMPHYFTGMRLILRFPYGEKISAHKKFLGTVVRLEDRTDGTQGVAVQFLL
ncbi:MAG TPA: PilZ domain-containing protein [Candidatus Micrarchaeaceae archaeon]|nr:PilZ domain-containing protein [Candidatus Micrarchaeaceae archaeon]